MKRIASAAPIGMMFHSVTRVAAGVPVGSDFTYQGQLNQAGLNANGIVDFELALWDDEVAGSMIGLTIPKSDVAVVNGLFKVELDYGADVFNGEARWLEIAVRSPHDPTDTAPFTTLTPRQPLTAAPYALQTRGLFVSDEGNVGIGTTTPDSELEVNRTVTATAFAGDGSGLTGINGDGLGDHTATENITTGDHWLSGDGDDEGILIADNGHIGIGTIDPQIEVHIKGVRPKIRLEAQANENPGVQFYDDFEQQAVLGWAANDSVFKIKAETNLSGDQGINIVSGGIVGIGTVTPATELDVAGTITADAIQFADGSIQTTASSEDQVYTLKFGMGSFASNSSTHVLHQDDGGAWMDGGIMLAPVNLPVRAQIHSISAHVRDDAAADHRFRFQRKRSSMPGFNGPTLFDTSGDAGYFSVTDETIQTIGGPSRVLKNEFRVVEHVIKRAFHPSWGAGITK
jgi:hypothetical protein